MLTLKPQIPWKCSHLVSFMVILHFLHGHLVVVLMGGHTDLFPWPSSSTNGMRSKGVALSKFRALRPLRPCWDTMKCTATSEICSCTVLPTPLHSGASPSPPPPSFHGQLCSPSNSYLPLPECHQASLHSALFACTGLFIANRALNLTLEMDIAQCVSARASEPGHP